MSQENRLSRIERGQPVRHTFPRIEHPAAPVDETDNLRASRGVVYSALLGGGLWLLIGFIIWFIAR